MQFLLASSSSEFAFFKSRIEFCLLCFASDARILKYFWHENWNNTNSARWSRAADNTSKPIQFWNTSLVHFRTLIKTFALKIRIFIQKSCLSLSETWETLISSTMFQDCLASGLLLRESKTQWSNRMTLQDCSTGRKKIELLVEDWEREPYCMQWQQQWHLS